MEAASETYRGTAVITGAGSGVGAGLARYAARLGMDLVLADIDRPAAQVLAAELEAANVRALACEVDVRDPDQVGELAETAYREFGHVRLLINNAGIEQFGYLWETPVENWRRIMDINVSGVFHGIRAFVPRMAQAQSPADIWNLSSMGGVGVAPRQAPYIVSKHAVLAMTECLRLEVEAAQLPINVAAVLPGPVASQIFERAGGAESSGTSIAESERNSMRAVHESAMDPVLAAEAVFEQAAAGEFYLLTHPELVRASMTARGTQLMQRRAPALR